MLTKILLTALVLALAWTMLKRRASPEVRQKEIAEPLPLFKRFLVPGAVGVTLILACGFFAWQWFDGYQVVSVTLVSPKEERREVYQVRKKDISTNELVTVDGLRIRLSSEERLMIAEKSVP
ncbi:hypothetical protein [Shewanella algae]|uniref:hypothetical protein n=1 Tax=Shewanella algae TaxID=38313 RepID=UPI0034D5240F